MIDLDAMMIDLASTIRSARDAADLTQVELAARLGVSVRSVQDWERAKAMPRAAQRRRLRDWLTAQEVAA